MAVVVDDHLLIDVLAETATPWLQNQVERSAIYTTGAWYYRLASAAHRGSADGSLSRRLVELPPEFGRERIDVLPDWIGLLAPRFLVPIMAALATRRRPNVLAAEALAVALVTDSVIAVAIEAPLIRDGALDLGIGYRLVEQPGVAD